MRALQMRALFLSLALSSSLPSVSSLLPLKLAFQLNDFQAATQQAGGAWQATWIIITTSDYPQTSRIGCTLGRGGLVGRG